MRIIELKRQAIKISSVTLELDAEDVCDFMCRSKYAINTENCSIIFARLSSFFDCFLSVTVEIVLVSDELFSSFVGFQSPHLGKLLGTGSISLSSPTLKISDIPISA